MKKFSTINNEYLKKQALLEKQYNDARIIPGSVNEFGIINSIDDKYNELSFEIIDNYIKDSLCSSYFSDNQQAYWDNIYETLITSHNSDKLINELKKYFDNEFITVNIINNHIQSSTRSFEIYIYDCNIAITIKEYTKRKLFRQFEDKMLPKELSDIMNFYNYYFSCVSTVYDEDYKRVKYHIILCEPKYSDKVTDIVYNKYNGVLYHVTLKENVDRILKRGLQVKGDKNHYRYIEPRINFYLSNNDDVKRCGAIIAKQKGYSTDSYVILKIDLNYGEKNKFNNSSYSLDFYHDNLYDNENYVYTYGLIHPRFISIYE